MYLGTKPFIRKINVLHSLVAVGDEEQGGGREEGGEWSWIQHMKGRTHPSLFDALSFLDSKQVPIYCWFDRKSFPVRWPSSGLTL